MMRRRRRRMRSRFAVDNFLRSSVVGGSWLLLQPRRTMCRLCGCAKEGCDRMHAEGARWFAVKVFGLCGVDISWRRNNAA